MTEITRAEFNEVRQKVEEIHRMLVNMGGQPNVVMEIRRMVPQTEDVTVTIPTFHEAIRAANRAAPDQWRIVSEGVLALGGTSYEIRLENVAAIAAFRIYHRGRSVEWELRLEKAKQTTLRHMREMIEMGVEP